MSWYAASQKLPQKTKAKFTESQCKQVCLPHCIWGGKKKPVSWELINSYLSVKYRWQFLFNTLLIYTTVRALTFDWGDGSEVSPGGISFTGRLSYYISSWLYWCKNLNTWRGTVSQQHFLKPTKNMTMYLIKALLIWVPPTWTPNLARDIKKT